MKSALYPVFIVFYLFTSLSLAAQSSTSEDSGSDVNQDKLWFDNQPESLRGGYFLSDRLLIGGSIGSEPLDYFNLGTFARYYLASPTQGWRPYVELGGNVNLADGPVDNIWGYYGGAGVEKRLKDQALLNVELLYTSYPGERDYGALNLSGNLNTTFGSGGRREAVANHFKRGTLIVGSQLFQASISDNSFVNITDFELSPQLGFMLSDRLMAKASLNLEFSSVEYEFDFFNIPNYERASGELELGLRYYINPGRVASFFVETNLGIDHNRFFPELMTPTFPRNYTNLRIDAQFGTSIFINRAVSIDVGLGAEFISREFGEDQLSGLGTFGVNYWFN